MPQDRGHKTTLQSPKLELGRASFKIVCHFDGEKIGETKFSKGSIEIVVKEGHKIIHSSGRIPWKEFYEMMIRD